MNAWPEWQSIESAPTTGELVMLHCPHSDPTVSVGFYDGEELGWLIIENDAMPSICRPTEWATMPAPPAPGGEKV